MAAAKVRDRRMVGDEVAGHDPVGDVLYAGALDPARGAVAARVGIEQERHHHRRLVGWPAVPVGPIGGVEGAQIEETASRIVHTRCSSGTHSRSDGGIRKTCSRSTPMKFVGLPEHS
jgi:hypothetical protein